MKRLKDKPSDKRNEPSKFAEGEAPSTSAQGEQPSTLVDSIDLMVSVSDEICVRQQQLSNTVVVKISCNKIALCIYSELCNFRQLNMKTEKMVGVKLLL